MCAYTREYVCVHERERVYAHVSGRGYIGINHTKLALLIFVYFWTGHQTALNLSFIYCKIGVTETVTGMQCV